MENRRSNSVLLFILLEPHRESKKGFLLLEKVPVYRVVPANSGFKTWEQKADHSQLYRMGKNTADIGKCSSLVPYLTSDFLTLTGRPVTSPTSLHVLQPGREAFPTLLRIR